MTLSRVAAAALPSMVSVTPLSASLHSLLSAPLGLEATMVRTALTSLAAPMPTRAPISLTAVMVMTVATG